MFNKTLFIFAILLGCALAENSVLNRINDYSTEDLKKLAIAGQRFDREKKGRPNLLGGLEDYINTLKPSQIIDIITNYIYKYPELNQTSVLHKLAGIDSLKDFLKLDEAIKNGSRKTLERLALECEAYRNKKEKTEGLLGGLVTYIWRMKEESIRDYLNECLNGNPELREHDRLAYMAEKRKISFETIKRILASFDRMTLTTIAIAADEYDREIAGPRVGGLADYIGRLSDEEIREAILTYAQKYPELKEEGYLRTVISRHKELIKESATEALEFLSGVERKSLNRIALSLEKYSRIANKSLIVGGLHDYIDSLNDSQVIQIIQEYLSNHRELGLKHLKQIAAFTEEDVVMSLVKLPLDNLRNVCIALEAYDREVSNTFLLGGLHDYVDTLGLDELMRYVLDLTEKHPILSLPGVIKSVAKKYEGKVHRH